jgi:hypothetical protein
MVRANHTPRCAICNDTDVSEDDGVLCYQCNAQDTTYRPDYADVEDAFVVILGRSATGGLWL